MVDRFEHIKIKKKHYTKGGKLKIKDKMTNYIHI